MNRLRLISEVPDQITAASEAQGRTRTRRVHFLTRDAQTMQAARTISALSAWLTRSVPPMYRLSVRSPSINIRPAP